MTCVFVSQVLVCLKTGYAVYPKTIHNGHLNRKAWQTSGFSWILGILFSDKQPYMGIRVGYPISWGIMGMGQNTLQALTRPSDAGPAGPAGRAPPYGSYPQSLLLPAKWPPEQFGNPGAGRPPVARLDYQ